MTDQTPGMTDAEKLAALGTYLKVLGGTERELRTTVTDDMGKRHVEKVGAYLPDGTKMASVARSDGKRTVKINEDAALKWCAERHPDEVVTVQMVRPAFLKKLADIAGSLPVGSKGLDSATGEELDFIEVVQGSPYVTVTTTKEGIARMEALAHGFTGMLEVVTDENGGPFHRTVLDDQYDPSFADRLENGAYER
jgi:hypothetical protein